MELELLIKGLVLGFSVAAPVGPIGILCIRRTLAEGRRHGLACGMGAATADAMYGLVAGLGLTAVSDTLVQQQQLMQAVGAVYLGWMGVRTLQRAPAEREANASGSSLLGAWASTFLLTVTNPATILSFAAMFAALGIGAGAGSISAAVFLVVGVLVGSAAWWLMLSGGVSVFRERVTRTHLQWVNRVSGVVLLGFSLWAVVSLLRA
ncbi:MAG: LysE family translocator [Myxococcota bacterium]